MSQSKIRVYLYLYCNCTSLSLSKTWIYSYKQPCKLFDTLNFSKKYHISTVLVTSHRSEGRTGLRVSWNLSSTFDFCEGVLKVYDTSLSLRGQLVMTSQRVRLCKNTHHHFGFSTLSMCLDVSSMSTNRCLYYKLGGGGLKIMIEDGWEIRWLEIFKNSLD